MSQKYKGLPFHFVTDCILYGISCLQVQLLQSSNKRDPKLKINNEQTDVENNTINFHHAEADYAKMMRAYIDTVTSNNHLFLF